MTLQLKNSLMGNSALCRNGLAPISVFEKELWTQSAIWFGVHTPANHGCKLVSWKESNKDRIELMNKSPQYFERLVLVCIDSYDSEKRRILEHCPRSTRFAFLCTAPISNFQQKCIYFLAILSWFFRKNSKKFQLRNFNTKFYCVRTGINDFAITNFQKISENSSVKRFCNSVRQLLRRIEKWV